MFIKINDKMINLDKVLYIDFYKDKAITFEFVDGGYIDIGVYIHMGIKITEEQYNKIINFLHQKAAEIF